MLLHGWPGFWYDWRRLPPLLARERVDAVAPDFRGFGDPDRPDLPPGRFATEGLYAADFLALLDHLGVRRCVVVGYDIGATVAQNLTRQSPERVWALVLFNPSYPGVGARRHEPWAQREVWYQVQAICQAAIYRNIGDFALYARWLVSPGAKSLVRRKAKSKVVLRITSPPRNLRLCGVTWTARRTRGLYLKVRPRVASTSNATSSATSSR
jgi:pimeloyl-ACP methyl ester carboxylesterase